MPITWDDDDPPALSAANLNEWGASLGSRELGYAEITSNATSTANYLSETDVAGLSVTVTVALRPIVVRVFAAQVYNTTAGERAVIILKEGTTALGNNALISTAASQPNLCLIERRLAPSAGSHTYKVMMSRISAGTATIAADTSNRAFIQVLEV